MVPNLDLAGVSDIYFPLVSIPGIEPLQELVKKINEAVSGIFDFVIPRNPVTKKREIHFIPESILIHQIEEAFPAICEAQGGILPDSYELKAWVSRVGNSLAAQSDCPDLPYEFVILNSAVVNAWSLPGGKIAICKGLLDQMKTEGQLASVLSHEIVHACARHSGTKMEFEILLASLAWLGAFAAELLTGSSRLGDLVENLGGAGGHLVSLQKTRTQEYEADYYGMGYMAKTGYNPAEFLDLIQILEGHEKSKNGSELLRTHPHSKNRFEQATLRLRELQGGKTLSS